MPNEDAPADCQLMCYIRRVNLDIFWSREPATVASNLRALIKGKTFSSQLGLEPVGLRMGPWPLADSVGFQICLEMLRASKMPGKNDVAYSQFDTIRKIRTGYVNCFECQPLQVLDTKTLKNDRGQFLTQVQSPTQSKLFRMFIRGCEKRMGRLVKQDLGLSIEVLLEMMKRLDMKLGNADLNFDTKRKFIVGGAAFVILWAGALRGGEVLLLEASELVKRRKDGTGEVFEKDGLGHVVIPLMGRFKGETGERNLILVLSNETSSELNVRKWVERLAALLLVEGKHKCVGPAICHKEGTVYSLKDLNDLFHEVLLDIQSDNVTLIPSDIDVAEKYNVYRSFRRGATTRAQEQNVPTSIIEMNNRWRKVQNSQGNLPRLPMTQLYMEITQVLKSKVLFSKSL